MLLNSRRGGKKGNVRMSFELRKGKKKSEGNQERKKRYVFIEDP